MVIKVTHPGKWGIDDDDLAYFKNLHDMNTLTNGYLKIEVLGITPRGTWPSAVTRMRLIQGKHPTPQDLREYLEKKGFEPKPFNRYDHLGSDVQLIDAHNRNFIQTPDGIMYPIDIHLRGDLRPSSAPRLGTHDPVKEIKGEKSIEAGGKTFIPPRKNEHIYAVKIKPFDAAWKLNKDSYIGAGGTENTIGSRYLEFKKFFAKNDEIKAPYVTINSDGSVDFSDGRHRTAFLRDSNWATIPMAMDETSRANAENNGYF